MTWLTRTRRVRAVTASSIASSACPGSAIGNGIRAITTVAPSRAATARIALIVALYSWSSVRSSSPGFEPQRPQDRVDARRGIAHECKSVGIRTEERSHGLARLVEETGQVAGQELDGLGFHAILKRPLRLEDRNRARAVRAVVQERDVGIETPAEIGAHRAMMRRPVVARAVLPRASRRNAAWTGATLPR